MHIRICGVKELQITFVICTFHLREIYIETSCGALKSVWMSFDCGLRGMTKWHHNRLDNNQFIWVCRCGCASTCMCGFVRLCYNTTVIRALTRLSVRFGRTEWGFVVCHHTATRKSYVDMNIRCQTEVAESPHLLPSGFGGLLTVLHINISISSNWLNKSVRGRLLSVRLEFQANVTCRATVWGGCVSNF